MLHPHPEAHSGPSQASKMDIFVKIVNEFKLKLPIIFAESLVLEGVLNTPLTSLNASN